MKTIKTDCLVIGSGIAGSLYAYMVAQSGLKCVLISASKLNDCNSNLAQGGIVYEKSKDFSELIKDIQKHSYQKLKLISGSLFHIITRIM